MNNKQTLRYLLAMSLLVTSSIYAHTAWAATNTNSGGIWNQPDTDDYTGTLDGSTITNTGGNVTIYENVDGYVHGGYAAGTTAANNNKVTIYSGNLKGWVLGGLSQDGSANNNTVTIYNATITEGGSVVFGAFAEQGTASNNVVNIYDGEITNVRGASGESSYVVLVDNNTVNIHGGHVADLKGGFSKNGAATNNTVNITGGTVGSVTGAVGGGGGARYNKVVVSGGTIVWGIIAGDSMSANDATNNTVAISGGNIGDGARIIAATVENGSANNNFVTIKGGTIGNNVKIYAGISYEPTAINNNTLTIEGTATFGSNLELYGGFKENGNANVRNGNTLNIYISGLTAKTVDNFQHYDLAMDKNKVTLTVTDALTLQADDTIKSTRVLSELNVGDTVSLLKSAGGLTLNGATLLDGKAKQGALYIYGYTLREDGGALVADILSKEGNKQTMSVADGQLAAMGMLRSGADLISGNAMATAAQNASQYDVFATMNYGNYNMNSVSNIDVQGTSMLVGVSRNLQHSNSNTTIGAFLESGWGTYDSELGEAKAKGHTNYYGLGILARNNHNSGLYLEGSMRVGKVGNTYSGHSADDGMYDGSSTYYGLHLGIGKINKINENTNIDYYGKYFWAHESGTDATLLGDKFDFDAIDSHRVRVGARLNNTNKNVTRYVGLAYEYEFSGTAKASAYGIDIASPSAKGSSGLLELGATYKPATDSRFSMDVGLNGYVGKRQGVSGNLKLNWAF